MFEYLIQEFGCSLIL